MTVKATTDPKTTASAVPAPGQGCCGGDAAAEPLSKTAKSGGQAAVGHAKPSKAAETCCCGGAGKK